MKKRKEEEEKKKTGKNKGQEDNDDEEGNEREKRTEAPLITPSLIDRPIYLPFIASVARAPGRFPRRGN